MKLDPTVLFYLRHKPQIDEWSSLSKQVPPVAHEFFWSLHDLLEERADDLPGGAVTRRSGNEAYPKVLLALPTWTDDAGSIRAAIGVEWYRPTVDFFSAYVGVWVNKNRDGGEALHAVMKEALAGYAATNKFKRTSWWPMWRYLTPPEAYWDHLDEFASQIVTTLEALWRDLYAEVDAILSKQKPT